mgnify:CR=1 FL=1
MTGNFKVPDMLVKNCNVLVTMNKDREELRNADIHISNGYIKEIGFGLKRIDSLEIIDGSQSIVTPGLINTHDHLFQSLTKAVPNVQNVSLFEWLNGLYPIWGKMNPEQIFTATQLGLSELAMSGCTFSADHMYLFRNGTKLDDTILAASEVGLRFYPTRGAMSIGVSKGGLPPDYLIEDEEAILSDMERVVNKFHQPHEGALVNVGLAPCSPFSVSKNLMIETANLARKLGVRLHTHLAESEDDLRFSMEKYGFTPGEYIQDLEWVGSDVWHAHCVKLSDKEVEIFKKTSTGVAHCPCSNCRLSSGIAPITKLLKAGVNVGLGVDGAASSDSAHLLNEARQTMLLQRLTKEGSGFSARNALEIATIGGARVLGRKDVGSIEIGKRADIAIWDLNKIPFSGAWDPVASLIFTGPHYVEKLIVEGNLVIDEGNLLTLDLQKLMRQAKLAVEELMNKIP